MNPRKGGEIQSKNKRASNQGVWANMTGKIRYQKELAVLQMSMKWRDFQMEQK